MRTLTAIVAAAVVLGGAAPAMAHEFKPSWGYAYIDDRPFYEPGPNGALLPASQVFPRGHIRDVPPADGDDVRINVEVYTYNARYPSARYHVDEGDFVDVSFDRPVDIAPFLVSYVKYDFCRFNPGNGQVEECTEALRLGRPDPPRPPDDPPRPPGPVDADGDGVPADRDCADNNATVWPGGREVPGNGLDDDCAGGDQPARVLATVQNQWKVVGARVRVTQLRVREAPTPATVEVRCGGKRCPFRLRRVAVKANGTAVLHKFFRRRLRAGGTIEVRILAPSMIGKVVRYTLRRGKLPQRRTLCLPLGVRKPVKC